MNVIILWIKILFAYLFLSGNISLYNLGFGILVASAILWLIPLNPKSMNVKHLVGGFRALITYLIVTARDTMRGAILVASLILRPEMPIKPGVVAVKPDCDHELGQALSAHSITLSPGELLIETDEDGTMYIHTLDVDQTAKNIQKGQAYRSHLINLIFR